MGAVVLSGDGEMIAQATAAAGILHDLTSRTPEAAIRRALDKVASLGGKAGVVLITSEGDLASGDTSRDLCVASMMIGNAEPFVPLGKGRSGQ